MITYHDTILLKEMKTFLEEKRAIILDSISGLPDYPSLRYQVGYMQCIKDIESMAEDLSRKLRGEL